MATTLAAAFLGGCAVDRGADGHLMFKLDEAEIFGTRVSTFALNGGDEGSLRVSNGHYSIKLRDHLKVIPLERALMARIVRADLVEDRTAVLVEKAEPGCNYKYQLVSIRQGEVLSWDFGDCNTQPLTAQQADQVTYDFARDNRVTRFTYRDARLLRSDVALNAPPPTSPGWTPAGQHDARGLATIGGDRYVPGLPSPTTSNATADAAHAATSRAASTSTSTGTATAAAAPRSAARPSAVAAPPASRPLTFSTATEQTPIRIVLDK